MKCIDMSSIACRRSFNRNCISIRQRLFTLRGLPVNITLRTRSFERLRIVEEAVYLVHLNAARRHHTAPSATSSSAVSRVRYASESYKVSAFIHILTLIILRARNVQRKCVLCKTSSGSHASQIMANAQGFLITVGGCGGCTWSGEFVEMTMDGQRRFHHMTGTITPPLTFQVGSPNDFAATLHFPIAGITPGAYSFTGVVGPQSLKFIATSDAEIFMEGPLAQPIPTAVQVSGQWILTTDDPIAPEVIQTLSSNMRESSP